MRQTDYEYEYLIVYVDDIVMISRDPEFILKQLQSLYELKGVGSPEYYSGADIYVDNEGFTCVSAKTYIKNICNKIETTYDVELKNYGSPMEAGDHPECDESEILGEEEKRKFQMLSG